MYWHIQNKFKYIYNILAKNVAVWSQIGLLHQTFGWHHTSCMENVFFFCYFTLESLATIDLDQMKLILSVKLKNTYQDSKPEAKST